MTSSTTPATCPSCGHEIDPDTCHCGEPMTGAWHDNHIPIPMGCDCGRVKKHELGTEVIAGFWV